jgi:hypothetical protein
VAVEAPTNEVAAFLAVFAALLLDNVVRLDETVGEALTRYAEAANTTRMEGDEHAELKRSIISAITVTDLQDRLLRRLQDDMPEIPAPEISPQELESVGVDVEF